MEQKRLLTIKEVMAMTSLSRQTIWRNSKLGSFPRPVGIGTARRWRLSDIHDWIDNVPCAGATPAASETAAPAA